MNYERSIVMQYENESENVASNLFFVKFFILVVILSYADTLADDDEFNEWLEEWKEIEPDEKLAHTQELFRMVLSDNVSTYYYSFCNDNIAEEDSDWHCRTCKTCHDWRVWHCQDCHQCMYLRLYGYINDMNSVIGTYGVTSPCERCGGGGSET